MSSLNLYGNHRGGTGIVNALTGDVTRLYDADWLLADPKEDRAEQLARVVRNRFPTVRPRPLCTTAQHALAYSGDDDTVVLAMDTVADMKETLEGRRQTQCATFQIIGRGPGGHAGTRTAIQGTLIPGDHDTARSVSLLFNTLEGMTRQASSRVLTGTDSLTASTLRPMRALATRQTVRHLMEKDREPWDLSGGPLSVIFGAILYPLVPVQGAPQEKYSHRKALALDVAELLPINQCVERKAFGRCAVVAVVVPEDLAIHFMTVAQDKMGKRHVDGVTVFAPPPARVESLQMTGSMPLSDIEPAVFTD